MSADFWAEMPSPLKHPLRNAFYDYAKKIYNEQKIIFKTYFPSVMGGDMPSSDYLFNMDCKDAPNNYLTMGFGECSDIRFYKKYIESGIFSHCEIAAWFAETMVVDKKRLCDRPIPTSFFDLTNPCYKNEICIIGTKEIPDPVSALAIFREKGKNAMTDFIENIAGFGAPVNAIRHIGKSSNKFGSIFIMPLLFANVCKEIPSAKVIKPKEGYIAEPFVFFSKNPNEKKSKLISDFIHSKEFSDVFTSKYFIPNNEDSKLLIFEKCRTTYFPELSEVYKILREKFSAL